MQDMRPAMRQRNVPPSVPSSVESRKRQRRVSWHEDVMLTNSSDDIYLSWYFIALYLLLLAAMGAVSMHFYTALPEPIANGPPNQFHALRARSHMEDLTALGIRHVGSQANEFHAKNLLINKVEAIRANASGNVEVELSVQHPSGGFYVDFLGGITHIYQNITNIVVRISRKGTQPKHAFMVNAHYDSALGSVAASDDAISCGTMLEVIRCLASDPDPLLAEHALIFLFNGAEETMLQASHGFITQHPWARTIRAFLNLEAAGAGGREIVFQTGPNHPWLARLYSNSVPYPHASVVAQDVFQSGVIPSDTDFRVFRDFGHIPGIDTAYFINGYIYHTEYDVPSAIPDGSIQRAGENVLALLREVANSPELSDPSKEDVHGKVVFFDILGLMTVVYSERVAMVLNFALLLMVVLTFLVDVDWTNSGSQDKPTPKLLLLSFGVMLLSWLAAVVVCVAIATLLSALGRSMTWFAQPPLVISLYALPAFLAIGEVHTQLIKWTEGTVSRSLLEKSALLSIQFLWSLFLFLLTSLHICSAFLFFVIVAFHLIFRSLLHDTLISSELRKHDFSGLHSLAFVLCSTLAVGFPLMLVLQLHVGLFQLFIPLMGRSGALVPPDLVVGILMAVVVATSTPHMVCVLIYSTSKELKRKCGGFLMVFSLLAIIMAGMGYFHPYSMEDPDFPKPKRLFLLHTDRTFHNLNGSVSAEDAKVVLYPFDYLGIQPIAEVAPLFKNAIPSECKGLYCSEPAYIPVRHLIESLSMPASRLGNRDGARIQLLSRERVSEHSENLTFQANFPLRCNGIIGTGEGVKLKAWSLESYIPPANVCPGSHEDRGCYFIFHSRGFGRGEFTFWIQIEGDLQAKELLRMAIAANYLDPPQSESADIKRLTDALPDWVTAVSWAAIYNEWIF